MSLPHHVLAQKLKFISVRFYPLRFRLYSSPNLSHGVKTGMGEGSHSHPTPALIPPSHCGQTQSEASDAAPKGQLPETQEESEVILREGILREEQMKRKLRMHVHRRSQVCRG